MADTIQPHLNLDPLALVGKPMRDTLDGIHLPAFVVDRAGALRWANDAAHTLLGQHMGQLVVSLIPHLGGDAAAYDTTLVDAEGARIPVRVAAAPMRGTDNDLAGVFALAVPTREGERPVRDDDLSLTPRQEEVLHLLAEGLSTEAVAKRLGVALETARNHIRAVLRRLDVHSRLEAVVEARRRGLLDD